VYERGTYNIFIMDAGTRGLSATAVSTNGAVLRPIDRAGAIGSKPRPGSAPSTSRARLATTAGTSCRCPSTHLQSAPSTTADTAAAVKIPGCIRCISAIPRWFVVMTCIPSRPANACRTRRASARHSTASLAAACWSETLSSGFRCCLPLAARAGCTARRARSFCRWRSRVEEWPTSIDVPWDARRGLEHRRDVSLSRHSCGA